MTGKRDASPSSYAAARSYVRGLALTHWTDYRDLVESLQPSSLPHAVSLPLDPPRFFASLWTSWADFLGPTYAPTYCRRRVLPYEEARETAVRFGIRNPAHYRALAASGRLPHGLPSFPGETYSKQRHGRSWSGWQDFLGEAYCPSEPPPRNFRHLSILPYDLAKGVAKGLGIGSSAQYRDLAKAGVLPHGLPRNPASSYGSPRHQRSWRGWADFLGADDTRPSKAAPVLSPSTNTIPNPRPRTRALAYAEAKIKLGRLNVLSKAHFVQLAREGRLPRGVPKNPAAVYAGLPHGCSWRGWHEFLSLPVHESAGPPPPPPPTPPPSPTPPKIPLETLAEALPNPAAVADGRTVSRSGGLLSGFTAATNSALPLVPLTEARAMVRSLGVSSRAAYRALVDSRLAESLSGSLLRLPANPPAAYLSVGWNGWENFLAPQDKDEA